MTDNIIKIRVKEIITEQVPEALNLAWKVFQEYESPDCSTEGTEEFRKCLHDNEYLNGIIYFGAYHRRGIGRSLFELVKSRVYIRPITLNSSPYGLPFYKALGFKAAGDEQIVNGIRFTPMIFCEDN